jgi:hypothetical protein
MDLARIYKLLDSRPFIPFDVDMQNGERIHVGHPENVTIFPDRVRVREILVYYPDRDDYSIIFPQGITALHVESRSASEERP